jgi:hypothetical protein
MGLDRDAFSEVFMIPFRTAVSSGFTFSENWSGFELKQNDQTVATLRRPSMWSQNFLVETLQLHTREKSVELHNVATLPENRLSLMVLFTLYRVRQAEDAAAAVSAAAS